MSRALSSEGYLFGKIAGAFITLLLFAFVPSLILALALMLTQTGSDYLSSLGVLAETMIAGLWAAIFFIPLGLLVSSLTEKKTYAAVATFLIVFVLGIVSSIFSGNNANWSLLGPQNVLGFSIWGIFGVQLPPGLDGGLLLLSAACFTILPMAATYWLLKRRE
jgi:ABC-type transport system involved in multi-copper enzyme maturation permease subunit